MVSAFARATVLASILVLASGCTDGTQPTAPRLADSLARSPVLFKDCIGWSFVGSTLTPWVQAKLPPGYEPVASVRDSPTATSPLALDVVGCESIHSPDGSVQDHVTFAIAAVALMAAGGHELEDGYNDYVFEVLFDAQALPGLAAHFAAFGWPVHDASVEVGIDSFHISSSDGIDYAFMRGANLFPWTEDNTVASEERDVRFHFVAANASFGPIGETETRGFALYGSTLTARGGFFGTVRPTPETIPWMGTGQLYGWDGNSTLRWADGTVR